MYALPKQLLRNNFSPIYLSESEKYKYSPLSTKYLCDFSFLIYYFSS